MRDIRFRAWDTTNKEMHYSIGLPSDMKLNESIKVVQAGGWILMQYTGLKDKNGKEIYEGDILATSNSDPEYDIWDKEEHGYISVYWNEETAGFSCRGDWTPDLDGKDESIYSMEFVEVIGNIYENKDLLK